jgi:hypothetical protein
LTGIEGVEQYAIVALLIFVPFFLAVTARVFFMKKSDIDAIARIPLEDEAR